MESMFRDSLSTPTHKVSTMSGSDMMYCKPFLLSFTKQIRSRLLGPTVSRFHSNSGDDSKRFAASIQERLRITTEDLFINAVALRQAFSCKNLFDLIFEVCMLDIDDADQTPILKVKAVCDILQCLLSFDGGVHAHLHFLFGLNATSHRLESFEVNVAPMRSAEVVSILRHSTPEWLQTISKAIEVLNVPFGEQFVELLQAMCRLSEFELLESHAIDGMVCFLTRIFCRGCKSNLLCVFVGRDRPFFDVYHL